AQRAIVVEPVGLDAVGAERALIEKFLHAGRGLEAPRAHEGAERGIDRERAIAASTQRRWQPAFHPAGGDLRHVIGEASKRARRKAASTVYSLYQLGPPAPSTMKCRCLPSNERKWPP